MGFLLYSQQLLSFVGSRISCLQKIFDLWFNRHMVFSWLFFIIFYTIKTNINNWNCDFISYLLLIIEAMMHLCLLWVPSQRDDYVNIFSIGFFDGAVTEITMLETGDFNLSASSVTTVSLRLYTTNFSPYLSFLKYWYFQQ